METPTTPDPRATNMAPTAASSPVTATGPGGALRGDHAHAGGFRGVVGSIGPFVAGLLLAAFLLAGMTGEAQVNQIFGLWRVTVRDGVLAAAWWLGAWGLGLGLTRLAVGPTIGAILGAATGPARGAERTSLDELAIALGLGSALMLAIDAVLGTLGMLGAGGGLAAWAPIGVGVVLAVRLLREAPPAWGEAPPAWSEAPPAWGETPPASRNARPTDDARASNPRVDADHDPIARALRGFGLGVATALLLVAASVAPGWLWSSEFGGYDALSYHLELPKEWFLLGRAVGPVDGNVYSALPSFVEGAFLQLMVMRGNPIDGAYACQWWSVGATLATAFVVARLARAFVCAGAGACVGAGALAAIAFLATPWTTVVGTLAYNDMYPCLALAAGWLLAHRATEDGRRLDARAAAALALLAAAAFGAKPSSVLFTAVPLGYLVLRADGRHLRLAPLALVVGVAVLAPWLVRNQLAYGNPFFPFLGGVLGTGPWSAEQMATFLGAHGNPDADGLLGWVASLPLVWQQWLGHGFGAAPAPNEPWYPLWGVVPLVGVLGLAVQARASTRTERRWAVSALAMLLLMIAGWIAMTHVKSRFLLPTAVPLALGTAVVLRAIAARGGARLAAGVAVAGIALPLLAFAREPVRGTLQLAAPALLVDGMGQRTGEMLASALKELPPDQRDAALKQADSAFVINYLLPADAKLLAVGFSTPFYILRPLSWSTVWDRGAFDRVIDAAPGTPDAWASRLRAEGFTHVVIDPVMLEVWSRSGWLNPAMASGPMLDRFVQANTVFARTIDGKLIVTLTAP